MKRFHLYLIGILLLSVLLVLELLKPGEADDTHGRRQSSSYSRGKSPALDSDPAHRTASKGEPGSIPAHLRASRGGELKIRQFEQRYAKLQNDPEELFPDAEVLKKPGLPESVYIESLHLLLEEYLIVAKSDGYPAGLNQEITNALLGDNPQRVALLPQSHPRISAGGELVDSWGTPYFFHANSLTDMDIRSAGEDLIFYTADDVVSE